MFRIGCHLSSQNGYLAMAEAAASINAGTFQFFTRNPRGCRAKPIDLKDIELFKNFCNIHDIKTILAHAPYTLNACSKDPNIRQFAKEIMSDDLKRLEYTPGAMYNFHPGCHVGQGVEQGISYIVEMLNSILRQEFHTQILLETMAGKGTEIGRKFEELREIIDQTEFGNKLGICLDTCHIWDGGYDIVNNLDSVLEEFDKIIGINRLRAIHLNDSKNDISSHKDRHECIGKGYIGIDALERVINHPMLKNLPFYLETPQPDLAGYGKEIDLLRGLYKNE